MAEGLTPSAPRGRVGVVKHHSLHVRVATQSGDTLLVESPVISSHKNLEATPAGLEPATSGLGHCGDPTVGG